MRWASRRRAWAGRPGQGRECGGELPLLPRHPGPVRRPGPRPRTGCARVPGPRGSARGPDPGPSRSGRRVRRHAAHRARPSPPCTSSALRRRAKRCGPRSEAGSCAGNGRTEAGRSTASGRGPCRRIPHRWDSLRNRRGPRPLDPLPQGPRAGRAAGAVRGGCARGGPCTGFPGACAPIELRNRGGPDAGTEDRAGRDADRMPCLPERLPAGSGASISPFPPTTPAAPFHASASRSSRILPRRSLDPRSPRENRARSMIEPETSSASRREADPSGIEAGAVSPVEVLVAGQGQPPAPASLVRRHRPTACHAGVPRHPLPGQASGPVPVGGPALRLPVHLGRAQRAAVLRRLAGPDAPRPGRQADPRALLHHAVLRPWMEIEKGRLERTPARRRAAGGLPPQGRHHRHARSPGDPSPRRPLADALDETLGGYTGVNLYASWAATRGFATHWDDHDVFVLQVAGAKRWHLYGETRRFPLTRDAEPTVKPPRETVWSGVLEAGDVFYIPRGWWHDARTAPGDDADGAGSLHLSCSVPPRHRARPHGVALRKARPPRDVPPRPPPPHGRDRRRPLRGAQGARHRRAARGSRTEVPRPPAIHMVRAPADEPRPDHRALEVSRLGALRDPAPGAPRTRPWSGTPTGTWCWRPTATAGPSTAGAWR